MAVRKLLTDAGVRFSLALPTRTGSSGRGFEVRFPKADLTMFFGYHPALAPAQVKTISQGLRAQAAPQSKLGIVVQRLSSALLDACKEEGIAACDLHGNAWLRLPNIYIERWRAVRGEQRASSGTVFTAKASRIVRAFLAHYPHDWSQSRLAHETEVSKGYVSTLVSRMVKHGYVSNRVGLLYLEEPDRLLDDWLAHYRFDRHRKRHYTVSMRDYEEGLGKVSRQLSGEGVSFSFTGWTGAYLRAAHVSPPAIMAYVDVFPEGSGVLFPVEKSGTLVLMQPHDVGVSQFTNKSEFGNVVSDAQLYLDLCRMPGRAREQADALRYRRLKFGSKS
jgi:hypothetical protein